MDSAILWRVAVVQVASVAALSLLLALIFSQGFFENWGWLVGPLSWLLCAWITARVVGLPEAPVLLRAALSGNPQPALRPARRPLARRRRGHRYLRRLVHTATAPGGQR